MNFRQCRSDYVTLSYLPAPDADGNNGAFSKHCTIYLDDILAFGKDMQEHDVNLKLVLDRLRGAGLTPNPKKCHFLQRSVTFLEHAVSSDGMAVTEDRTNQVRTWLTPTNQTFRQGLRQDHRSSAQNNSGR
ncbi:Retrovirus-related Pol polyprotein from transposon [Taenia solium]|eukprot:TsM_001082100 transcript=TsM_001082100 gene=TsM_001082100